MKRTKRYVEALHRKLEKVYDCLFLTTIKEAIYYIEVIGVHDTYLTLFSSYMTGWRQGILTLQ